ncbi:MAG TPA: hypothetical protein VK158_03090 [Acidobacteriota bacterium]|nr:hypothetical protein [Acidobacteriota bacterium]
MRAFLFRVTQDLGQDADVSELPVDYVAGDGLAATPGDFFVVYLPISHKIIGIYEMKDEKTLKRTQAPKVPLTLKDVVEKLSIVSHMSDTVMRMFKKKCREISIQDLEYISSRFSAKR